MNSHELRFVCFPWSDSHRVSLWTSVYTIHSHRRLVEALLVRTIGRFEYFPLLSSSRNIFSGAAIGKMVFSGKRFGNHSFLRQRKSNFWFGEGICIFKPPKFTWRAIQHFPDSMVPKIDTQNHMLRRWLCSWIGICYIVPWRVWYTPAFFGHRPSFCQLKTRLAFESWEYIKPRATLIAELPATWRKPDLEWHDERCGIVMSNYVDFYMFLALNADMYIPWKWHWEKEEWLKCSKQQPFMSVVSVG